MNRIGHRVAVQFSVAGLDDEDGVQDPAEEEENEADQHEAEAAAMAF